MIRLAGNPELFADRDPFWAETTSKYEYHSPEKKRVPFLARYHGLNGFRFHFTACLSIIRGSLTAMRNKHTDLSLSKVSLRIIHHVERVGGRISIEGLKHLADIDGPVVFISNHMSSLETYLIPGVVLPFTDVTFVLKQSLTVKPGIGPLLRAMHPVAVGRADPRADLKMVLEEGPKVLAEGKSIVVFPQSTRTAVFSHSAFNSLGVKLARKAGVKVIPVALKTDMVQNGATIKDFGPVDVSDTVHMEFGPIMEITGNGREQQEQVVEFITSRLKSWGGTVAD